MVLSKLRMHLPFIDFIRIRWIISIILILSSIWMPIETKRAGSSLLSWFMLLNERVTGRLVVTHGEKGAYYICDETLHHVPVPDVKAVDTVGAGDNFHAAFALALTRGLDIHQMVKFAVAVASLSCREYGGREGVPTWDQALEVAETLTERIISTVRV